MKKYILILSGFFMVLQNEVFACNSGDYGCEGENTHESTNCCYRLIVGTDENGNAIRHAEIYADNPNKAVYVGHGGLKDKSLTSVLIPNSVVGIGGNAFKNNNLMFVDIPDSVQYIYGNAFGENNLLKVILADTVMDLKINAFGENFSGSLICKGNNCGSVEQMLESRGYTGVFFLADEVQCTGANYYWSGASCNNKNEGVKCVNGYAKLKDRCVDPLKTFAKKHYTPAEAAQWLRDDDNNTIIITFKK